MIRVVDYGVGNVQAFMNVFKQLGVSAQRASTSYELEEASHLILPGVGHFDHAMQKLNESGMRSSLERLVLKESVPIIGVCVGMQMLAEGSDEGMHAGLGWIPGKVRAFESHRAAANLPMPHMGWNTVSSKPNSQLFSCGFEEAPQFYFLHSFYFEADNKDHVSGTASYGVDFDAAVSRGHIHGVQFHPEKSHMWGAQLLKNFVELSY